MSEVQEVEQHEGTEVAVSGYDLRVSQQQISAITPQVPEDKDE